MNILVAFGTRPEAIKLFPVIHALKRDADFDVTVCVTAQHRQLLDQVLEIANIEPDLDLDIMQPNQTLPEMTSRILRRFDDVLASVAPDRVMVQGDTTTAMAAALSAYYRKIPVDHVEAGLRSGDIYSPWPEEANRKVIGAVASLHFAPTVRAAEALIRENVPRERIFVTGNTVIDALLQTKRHLDEQPRLPNGAQTLLPDPGDNRHIILVTAHRRENFDGGMERIAAALLQIVERKDVLAIFPVHPNPNVVGPMRAMLGSHPRVRLLSPQDYVPFVHLLSRSHLVLTDSGGVQEEASALGVACFTLRPNTERPVTISHGTNVLLGDDPATITGVAPSIWGHTPSAIPLWDGHAAERVADVLVANYAVQVLDGVGLAV